MMATRDFLDTGPDDGSACIGDPEAHLPPSALPPSPDCFGYLRWTPTSCRRCGYERADCTCIGGFAEPAPPARPAPVMPPACVPGYPELVILALRDAHEAHVALGWAHYRFTSDETRPQRIMHRQLAVLAAARATAVVQCLRDAGHHTDADALRAKAAALNEALHAVPADLEERMDLMDAALPGERA